MPPRGAWLPRARSELAQTVDPASRGPAFHVDAGGDIGVALPVLAAIKRRIEAV
jgi:hypothetical protein